VNTNTLTAIVQLTDIGGDDGYVYANAIIGNITGPTDAVPDSEFLALFPVNIFMPIIMR
jgi:hypothetical protein